MRPAGRRVLRPQTGLFGLFRRLAPSLLFAALLIVPASAQEFEIPTVTTSGGGLPHGIRMAAADADAFRRRVAQPPRLEDVPDVSGSPYVVTTSYWASAVRLEEGEDILEIDLKGDYYPDGGYVRVPVGGQDAWLVLDLRQRAILDRYIRLAEAGAISAEPSTLDVLAAASSSEAMGVEAGGDFVAPEVASALLSGLAQANPKPFLEPREPPAAQDDGFWLTVTLLEGRSLRYFYDGATLTESLGTERYDASSVAQALAAIAPAGTPAIGQEEPEGSLLWWPVMVGGGLAALGAAVWLRRRGGPTP